ncbi:hypothetical protein Bbelb_278410 [Branchiostoma belcheri]|nr:hypothetical protein Bbelb_278410 [Branchiostoma belcheri]
MKSLLPVLGRSAEEGGDGAGPSAESNGDVPVDAGAMPFDVNPTELQKCSDSAVQVSLKPPQKTKAIQFRGKSKDCCDVYEVYECHNSGRKLEKWRETYAKTKEGAYTSPTCGHYYQKEDLVAFRRAFAGSRRKFGPARKLCGRDLPLMTLIKLRLGLLNEDLADRFGVSTSTCSRVLTTTLKFLSSELKCLICKPAEEVQKANLPRRFQSQPYQNVRHIIDCTVFIETPKNLEVKAQTWSNYKHHQTVKCLVSITPTGHFNFVSEAWGGRASDKQLTHCHEMRLCLQIAGSP